MNTYLKPQGNNFGTLSGQISQADMAKLIELASENNGTITATVEGIVIEVGVKSKEDGKIYLSKNFPIINGNRMNQTKGNKMFGSGYGMATISGNGQVTATAAPQDWVAKTLLEILGLDYSRAGGYHVFTAE